MLYELVQQSRVSKSEWVLRPPLKFQTRLYFFLGVEGIPFSYSAFLYPSHLLVSPPDTPESVFSVLWWAETKLCLSGRGWSSHWPQRVQSCLRAAWLWWGWLWGLACCRAVWGSWSTLEIAEVTDGKHLEQWGGQICCIAGFWECLWPGKDYSKQQHTCMACGVMQRKTAAPVASSPFLSAGAKSSDPWHVLQALCACTSLAGTIGRRSAAFL